MDVTVVIPTIPGREAMLARAVESARAQTLAPAAVLVLTDRTGRGAAGTRDQLLASVRTEWVAPLDDDDEYLPDHLAGLAAAARAGADLAFSWYEIVGPTGQVEQWRDPHARWEGVPWDGVRARQVPTTFLARTGLLRAVGGWTDYARWVPGTAGVDGAGNRVGEDTLLVQRAASVGATIVHVPARSYRWHHHGVNTSGRRLTG